MNRISYVMYSDKEQFARYLDGAKITSVTSRVYYPTEMPPDDKIKDLVDVTVNVAIRIRFERRKRRIVTIRFSSSLDERQVWCNLARAWDRKVAPSRLRVKVTEEAFANLMQQVHKAIRKERSKWRVSRMKLEIQKTMADHFLDRFERAKNAFIKYLDYEFKDLTEEELLTMMRERRIANVMEA